MLPWGPTLFDFVVLFVPLVLALAIGYRLANPEWREGFARRLATIAGEARSRREFLALIAGILGCFILAGSFGVIAQIETVDRDSLAAYGLGPYLAGIGLLAVLIFRTLSPRRAPSTGAPAAKST